MDKTQIKAILFDLDDTLLRTHEVFRSVIEPLKKKLSKELNTNEAEFDQFFEEAIVKSYHKVKVNHVKLWKCVLQSIDSKYNFPAGVRETSYGELMRIYTIIPEVFEDSIPTLKALVAKGYTLGIVTHSNPDWAKLKIEKTGLKEYFQYIKIVSSDKFKGSEDWAEAVVEMKMLPSMTVAVGDNVKGDAQAALDAGCSQAFLLIREIGWSVYKSGDIPKGTLKIMQLKDLLKYL